MMKNSARGYLVLGILLIVVSVVAFAIPTEKTAAFWIAYAFTVVAFVAQIPIWKANLGRDDTLKSKFLGLPVLHIGIVYLLVQLVVFAVFLFMSTLPTWSAVVVCVVIAGAAAVCMIAADTGRSEIERVEAKVQGKVFYIKALQADVELLADRETNSEVKTALMQLAEKIRFSDPMSHEQLECLEAQIAAKVSELNATADKTGMIEVLNSLLDERNKKCKMLK